MIIAINSQLSVNYCEILNKNDFVVILCRVFFLRKVRHAKHDTYYNLKSVISNSIIVIIMVNIIKMFEIWTRSHQNDDVREAYSRRIIQEINQIW